MAADPLTAALDAAANVTRLVLTLQQEMNTPEMVEAAARARDLEAQMKVVRDIARRDTAAIQREIAE